MYNRNDRGQGMRYQENSGFGGSDAFMDRFSQMGQSAPYAQEQDPAMQRGMGGGYGQQGGMNAGYGQQAMPGAGLQGGYPQPQGADLEALRGVANQIRMQLDDMHELYQKNAACVDEIREIIDGEDRRIRTMLEQAGEAAKAAQTAQTQGAAAPAADSGAAIEASVNRIKALLDERADEDRREREEEKRAREEKHAAHEREMEERRAEGERRMEERANLENARREADARRQDELQQTLDDLKAELTRFGEQLGAMQESVAGFGSVDVSGVTEQLRARADETDKNTHDVGVRIYRNVQASMNDYLAKQTSTLDTAITGLNQRMEAMEDSFLHRKSATTPLTVAALVTGLVNLGVLVVYILSNY